MVICPRPSVSSVWSRKEYLTYHGIPATDPSVDPSAPDRGEHETLVVDTLEDMSVDL